MDVIGPTFPVVSRADVVTWEDLLKSDLTNGLLSANATGYSQAHTPSGHWLELVTWSCQLMADVASATSGCWAEADCGGSVGWLRLNSAFSLSALTQSQVGAFNGPMPFPFRLRCQNGAVNQSEFQTILFGVRHNHKDGLRGGSQLVLNSSNAPPAGVTVTPSPLHLRALGGRVMTVYLYCDRACTLWCFAKVGSTWRRVGNMTHTGNSQLTSATLTPIWDASEIEFRLTNTSGSNASELRLYVAWRPISS